MTLFGFDPVGNTTVLVDAALNTNLFEHDRLGQSKVSGTFFALQDAAYSDTVSAWEDPGELRAAG